MPDSNFANIGKTLNVNYEEQGIVTGKTYTRYYGAECSGAYIMIPYTMDSSNYRVDYMIPGTSFPYTNTTSFDLDLDRNTFIGGDIYVNISYEGEAVASAQTYYLWIYFYHVSAAAVETLMASVQTARCTTGTAAFGVRKLASVALPKTQFKVGEKFRMKVEQHLDSGSNSSHAYFYCDPTGRKTTAAGDGIHTTHATTLLVDIPFAAQAEF